MSLRWTPEQLAAHLTKRDEQREREREQDARNRRMREALDKIPVRSSPTDLLMPVPKRSKYGNRAVVIDGIRFDSKAEAAYYELLEWMRLDGVLRPPHFLLQVPFRLPGNITYRVDFQVFHVDGSVEFIDVKGVLTRTTLNKLKQVRALYHTTVRCVRKRGGGFVEYDWTSRSR
jgi:hypothetical protein